jgi:fimbrial chaperone protein
MLSSLFRAVRLAGLAGAAFSVFSAATLAANLQVLPLRLQIRAPEAADTFTLRNNEKRPLNVQVRIFRAVQENGAERLEPTRDVVVSPPMIAVRPGSDYQVRVVRTRKQPVVDRENYRLVIDELPDPKQRQAGAVNFAIRYSLPVAFLAADR